MFPLTCVGRLDNILTAYRFPFFAVFLDTSFTTHPYTMYSLICPIRTSTALSGTSAILMVMKFSNSPASARNAHRASRDGIPKNRASSNVCRASILYILLPYHEECIAGLVASLDIRHHRGVVSSLTPLPHHLRQVLRFRSARFGDGPWVRIRRSAHTAQGFASSACDSLFRVSHNTCDGSR